MYTTSIVAKMHKIQFIRKKENIFDPEKDSGISENKQFLTVVSFFLFFFCDNKTTKRENISQAELMPRLFFTIGNFNENSVSKNGRSLI